MTPSESIIPTSIHPQGASRNPPGAVNAAGLEKTKGLDELHPHTSAHALTDKLYGPPAGVKAMSNLIDPSG